MMSVKISALARFVFHYRRSPPARLLFSQGCHEAECESKYVWPTLSSILSQSLRVLLAKHCLLEVSSSQ